MPNMETLGSAWCNFTGGPMSMAWPALRGIYENATANTKGPSATLSLGFMDGRMPSAPPTQRHTLTQARTNEVTSSGKGKGNN